MRASTAYSEFGSRLNLAKVTSYDFKLDETGNPVLDAQGNPVPSGLLNVRLLDRSGTRNRVPFVVATGGNSMFAGGLPEVGSLCVMGWREQNQPLIIGFLPNGIAEMVTGRETVPNLEQGEVLLQASKHDVDDELKTNFFRGGRLWLDRYGRVRIDTQDYELVTGYLLSSEFTPEVSVVSDPVTGEPIFLREKIMGGTERRVDDKGNSVFTYGQDKHELVGRNVFVQVKGNIDQRANAGQKFYDDRGNLIQIAEDGTITIKTTSGALVTFSQGSATHEVAGYEDRRIQLNLSVTVGENYTFSVGGNVDETIVGTETRVVQGGDATEEITTGTKKIIADKGIVLETVEDLAPVLVGSEDADEPLVLGDTLVEAIDQLIHALTDTPVGFGNLGAPVPWNPAIITALETFKTKYLSTPSSNIISQKCFTERR